MNSGQRYSYLRQYHPFLLKARRDNTILLTTVATTSTILSFSFYHRNAATSPIFCVNHCNSNNPVGNLINYPFLPQNLRRNNVPSKYQRYLESGVKKSYAKVSVLCSVWLFAYLCLHTLQMATLNATRKKLEKELAYLRQKANWNVFSGTPLENKCKDLVKDREKKIKMIRRKLKE